ncbi:MAG TPA: hypothetical protein VKM94_22520 [Blastocatellia bacterium]|nr:hypothetical protein [Blastocatellia bacterium]
MRVVDSSSLKSAKRLSVFFVLLALLVAPVAAQIEFKKPKPTQPLPNPSILGATRDDIVRVTKQMLETREIPMDKEDCNPTTGECTLISKPVVFIIGIATRSQLLHFTDLSSRDVRNWGRGRYVLRVQVNPASPRTAQVGVYARFEGLINSVSGNEWVALTSKGELEDQMLRCIQDRTQGGDCKDIFR